LTIPPPFPAPYLSGITSLPDQAIRQIDGRRQLPRGKERTIEISVRDLAHQIRREREKYEQANGVVIEPEPVRLPLAGFSDAEELE
jgi:hypothetical protein